MINKLKKIGVGKKGKELIIDFIKFGIVGIINTFTSYIIVNSCFYLLHIDKQIANLIAFIISVLVSFSLNSKFVFKKKFKNKKDIFFTIGKTYLSYAFTGLFLTAILLEVECTHLNIPLYIASFMNLIITVPINFLLNRFWAYKKKKDLSKEMYESLAKKHTFTICAYKESEYLEECIKSVINQDIKTNYLIATSTPNEHIKNISDKYNIPLFIRKGESDIQKDWNFAYNCANTELVTIAHQDDIYEKNYTKEIFNSYDSNILMYNTNYYPFKNGNKSEDENSKIKELLKFLVKYKFFARLKLFKVLSLSFGNSINCPSVTYNKDKLGKNLFTSDLKFALDWDTFLKIAKMKGISLYIPKKLINYRIHDGATTKQFINDNNRYNEDLTMFKKIWPSWVAKLIMKIYVKSYDTYN